MEKQQYSEAKLNLKKILPSGFNDRQQNTSQMVKSMLQNSLFYQSDNIYANQTSKTLVTTVQKEMIVDSINDKDHILNMYLSKESADQKFVPFFNQRDELGQLREQRGFFNPKPISGYSVGPNKIWKLKQLQSNMNYSRTESRTGGKKSKISFFHHDNNNPSIDNIKSLNTFKGVHEQRLENQPSRDFSESIVSSHRLDDQKDPKLKMQRFYQDLQNKSLGKLLGSQIVQNLDSGEESNFTFQQDMNFNHTRASSSTPFSMFLETTKSGQTFEKSSPNPSDTKRFIQTKDSWFKPSRENYLLMDDAPVNREELGKKNCMGTAESSLMPKILDQNTRFIFNQIQSQTLLQNSLENELHFSRQNERKQKKQENIEELNSNISLYPKAQKWNFDFNPPQNIKSSQRIGDIVSSLIETQKFNKKINKNHHTLISEMESSYSILNLKKQNYIIK